MSDSHTGSIQQKPRKSLPEPSPNKMNPCIKCGLIFGKLEDYAQHMERFHPPKPAQESTELKLRCHECGQEFGNDEKSYKEHLLHHDLAKILAVLRHSELSKKKVVAPIMVRTTPVIDTSTATAEHSPRELDEKPVIQELSTPYSQASITGKQKGRPRSKSVLTSPSGKTGDNPTPQTPIQATAEAPAMEPDKKKRRISNETSPAATSTPIQQALAPVSTSSPTSTTSTIPQPTEYTRSTVDSVVKSILQGMLSGESKATPTPATAGAGSLNLLQKNNASSSTTAAIPDSPPTLIDQRTLSTNSPVGSNIFQQPFRSKTLSSLLSTPPLFRASAGQTQETPRQRQPTHRLLASQSTGFQKVLPPIPVQPMIPRITQPQASTAAAAAAAALPESSCPNCYQNLGKPWYLVEHMIQIHHAQLLRLHRTVRKPEGTRGGMTVMSQVFDHRQCVYCQSAHQDLQVCLLHIIRTHRSRLFECPENGECVLTVELNAPSPGNEAGSKRFTISVKVKRKADGDA